MRAFCFISNNPIRSQAKICSSFKFMEVSSRESSYLKH